MTLATLQIVHTLITKGQHGVWNVYLHGRSDLVQQWTDKLNYSYQHGYRSIHVQPHGWVWPLVLLRRTCRVARLLVRQSSSLAQPSPTHGGCNILNSNKGERTRYKLHIHDNGFSEKLASLSSTSLHFHGKSGRLHLATSHLYRHQSTWMDGWMDLLVSTGVATA